ncbi:transcription factor E2F2 [Puma concolor]|uniref:Transcription factor E2F2 n=1 Tax=Puma concolor TaxID=9696 RepID=A0A6P6HZS8_PUMCO|nr:transcription factor E2F2 [Puma concolor]
MLRGPRALAPAAGPPSKGLPAMSPTELWPPGLSSPQLCPATTTYYTSLYPQTVPPTAAPGTCLDATPHGPEGQAVRCVPAGRLPAKRKLDLEGIGKPAVPEFRTPKGKCIRLDGLPSPKTSLHSHSASPATLAPVIFQHTRGRGMFEDPTRPGKRQQLGQELKELMSTEQALDQLIQTCSLNFKHLTEDKANKRLAYVTYQDIRAVGSFKEQTVIVVKAPPQTRLEVPDRSEVDFDGSLRALQIYLQVLLEEEEKPGHGSGQLGTDSWVGVGCLTRLFGATGPGMTFVCSSPGPALTPQQALQLPAPPPPPLPLVPLEATDSMLELPHPLLQQTEDQFLSPTLPCSSPLISFSPPLDQDDYLWGLDGGEGISDLFDSYDLGDLLIN